ncbi:circularly permuted type 2 ATP-grasp protein [Nocardia puris]|uniref:Putative circularly permuted ATP-grasp superfamily protein n=1 Tax=Nocardia puris TaxID=208602 RepID=A0A366D2G1_9NOCA|nr:circularly permuted type 2 ATP-grasp protein [Nocardia puris]MBF6213886.1 circularly permuted type 2 ATP-grasp protein [Nocardia puris]MBF6368525.1 circularly permuted type 2 ATP-grasp protein [Nocardia puris]MBF6463012.1 circularly permuted type 2 ATP-grasp protein [Nocardia puris]RBO84243.1 putative circularly permuted ATP-grasp superfamily protein [Nocardia puris]
MVAEAARPMTGARDEIAEQFARYRAEGGAVGAYDECGGPMGGYFDELVDSGGRVRRMWSELSADFVELGTAGLGRLDTRVRRLIEDDGITYTEVGAGDPAVPTPWRLDPIPLLVSADDWTRLEAGLVQRSRVLDEVLTDVYGPRRTLTSGLLPPEVVFGNDGYVRAAHGITIPGRHQLFLHACDISRWGDGRFRAIADWAQAPSGAGYALADRRVVSTAIPEAFEHSNPRPLTPFARAMRLMLIESAPMPEDDPVVVVLSPGVHSETAFDQAYLAATLGFPLVESADLVVRDGSLWMRSLGALERVDVVLRRVDAEFSDPLDLRPDSHLGVVGLVEVLRRGAVTVVNTLGSGLLESPALPGFLPAIARALLGEELLLESAPSYWGGDAAQRSHLLANLDRLILRSAVDGATLFGPELAAEAREELRARIEAEGWKWVGQEPAQFSLAPAVHGYGGLSAAPVGMRLFSLARRGGYTAMAGGLGQLRQRIEPSRSVIKVAAKDVWVRAAPAASPAVSAEPPHEDRAPRRAAPVVEAISSPRVLNDLFWMGRYAERAESLARLLIATHDRYQDYRYRPWLEGAEAVPVLMAALSRLSVTPAPPAVLADPRRRRASMPEAQAAASDRAAGEGVETETSTESAGPSRASAGDQRPGIAGAADASVGAGGASGSAAAPGGSASTATHSAIWPAVAGASREGHDYLEALTIDRDMPGSLAFAIDRYGSSARAVRDQLSEDTWMILSAVDRALAEYRGTGGDQEAALSAVHSLTLAALLSLSGIGAESLVRDTGWYVMDIGKRIERGVGLTALLSAALTETYPAEAQRVVIEAVLQAAESSVSYRRRHRDSVRLAAVAGLLLFDAGNPRSLAYQLERLEADFQALPGASGSSRPQRLLADAQRMLRRVDPAELEHTDEAGRRTELIELLDGVHLRLRKVSESFETTKLALPVGIQPLWGSTRVVE